MEITNKINLKRFFFQIIKLIWKKIFWEFKKENLSKSFKTFRKEFKLRILKGKKISNLFKVKIQNLSKSFQNA